MIMSCMTIKRSFRVTYAELTSLRLVIVIGVTDVLYSFTGILFCLAVLEKEK